MLLYHEEFLSTDAKLHFVACLSRHVTRLIWFVVCRQFDVSPHQPEPKMEFAAPRRLKLLSEALAGQRQFPVAINM